MSGPATTFAFEGRTVASGAWPLFFIPSIFMEFTATHSQDQLFDAARRGDVPALQAALAAGVPVDAANDKGFTALILAAYGNYPEAVRFLLDAGANPNHQDYTGNTALMGVSFKGHPEIARLLIERGAGLDWQNGNGGTALMFAAMFGRHDVLKLLLEAGANQRIADFRGLTALALAGQQGNATAWALLGGEVPNAE